MIPKKDKAERKSGNQRTEEQVPDGMPPPMTPTGHWARVATMAFFVSSRTEEEGMTQSLAERGAGLGTCLGPTRTEALIRTAGN